MCGFEYSVFKTFYASKMGYVSCSEFVVGI